MYMDVRQIQAWIEWSAIREMTAGERKPADAPDVSASLFSDLLQLYLNGGGEGKKGPNGAAFPPTSGILPPVSENPLPPASFPDKTGGPEAAAGTGNTVKSGAPENIRAIIRQAAERYQLPAELIARVIKQESNFRQFAVSPAGASGYMQLMPQTAKSLGVKNIFDPYENIMAGSKYLRQLLDRYGSVELALAAYNAGPGNVDKYGGIPPFKETVHYVRSILKDLKV